MVVIALGVPLVFLYAAARIDPNVLWFDELGQSEVFTRVFVARVELHLLVNGVAAAFIGTNLAVALRGTEIVGTRVRVLGLTLVALVTGNLVASSAEGHWRTFVLWQHRQPFGVADPIEGNARQQRGGLR